MSRRFVDKLLARRVEQPGKSGPTGTCMLVFACCALTCARVMSDGCFMPPIDYSGKDLTEPCQRAIVIYRFPWESLVLYVDYDGGADSFAWVIPTPSKPEVKTAPTGLLREAAEHYHRLELLAVIEQAQRESEYGSAGGGGEREAKVTVHFRKLIGPYEMAVVSAQAEDALQRWLDGNRFRIPSGGESILRTYIEEGWHFTAIRVRTKAGDRRTLPPVRLDFLAEEPVYPLRISGLNPGLADIRVYFFRPAPDEGTYEEYGWLGYYPVGGDFREWCPDLVREYADVPWGRMLLTRVADRFPPEVLVRLDDRLHTLAAPYGSGRSHFFPEDSTVVTEGAVAALLSDDPAVSAWGREKLSNYWEGLRRPPRLPEAHRRAVREEGTRLGAGLRDLLLEEVVAYIRSREKELRAAGVDEERVPRQLASCPLEIWRTVALLAMSCDPDDRKVLFLLSRMTSVTGGDTLWGHALATLGSPSSRRALTRIAQANLDCDAALRLVYSLENHDIDATEKEIAVRELRGLISAPLIRDGKMKRRILKLLERYSDADDGTGNGE